MTDNVKPVDQASRERIKKSLKETLFVEAGAGTGKTTSLVARIVSLVKEGNAIGRIAAITFTEAAAAELRDRVRRELEKIGNEEGNAFCLEAAGEMDSAYIQTLHSFAGSLLRERPLEAGLPPGFEVVEEIEAGINFEEKWQEWLESAMNSEVTGSSLIRCLRLGLSLDSLKEVALNFFENYDILPPGLPAEAGPDMKFITDFISKAEEIGGLLNLAYKGENDPLVKHCNRLLEAAQRMESADPKSDARLVILSRTGKLSFSRGSQADWGIDPETGENACKIIKRELKLLQESVEEGLAQARRAAMMPLLDNLREFARDYAAGRCRAGGIQFHDLLVKARDLLKYRAEARRYFQQKFSHILIDEFQDTDPIQAEIAFFLAEDPGEKGQFETDWLKIKPAPGKLFVVGDPKQSIYRFRRADIIITREVKRLIAGDGKDCVVPLIQNFRSLSPVISWVNAVFSKLMTDVGAGNQADYLPLEPPGEAEGGDPPPGVHYLGGPVEERTNKVRREESREIARTILMLKNRPWQVREGKNGGWRGVKYQDICILMPNRTGLAFLERALDEWDIPYRIESQSMLLGTQDVKELLACLRAIDDPSDRVALTAALRSSAFSISDIELVQFLDDGGNLDYTNPGEAEGPVKEALKILANYHKEHTWQAPADVIEDFIRERGMEEVCFGRSRPRERLHRLHLVVEKARAFSEAGESSLRGFLDWIERLADENARMVEVPVPETDEDAVRIMTIHAAKGREFPVVIMMGLGYRTRDRGEQVIFDRREGTVEVSIGSSTGQRFTTRGYEEACEREKAAEEAERIRLMYVAATRAKDHLIVSLYRPDRGGESSFASKLEATCQDMQEIWRKVEPQESTATGAMETGETGRAVDIDTEEDRSRWLEEREAMLNRASRSLTIAATRIARINKEADESEFPHRTGRGGTKLGRAVHSVLQSIDPATAEGLDKAAAAQAANEGIIDRTGEVIDLVKRALESGAVKRALASGRYYREVYVNARLENCSVDGFIDLLFEEEDGFVIVDYKTDDVDEEPSEDKSEQYSIQAGIYALAAHRVTGKPVKEVILLFLRAGKEISFTNLEKLMAAAERAAVRAI